MTVEVGKGGVESLVSDGLLKQYLANNRYAVGEACLSALEQWVRMPVLRTGLDNVPSFWICPTYSRNAIIPKTVGM